MRKYLNFKTESGNRVPHSTVRGLKLAIQRKKLNPGIYIGECPCGHKHVWEIEHTSTHTSVGYSPRRKAARKGSGMSIYNYTAKLKSVKQ
jgi:hypothetical protein